MMCFVIIFFLTGIFTGILAVMFGFGGGYVVVPLLFWILPKLGVNNNLAMHMAIGTSLMFLLFNMILTSRLHHAKGNIQMPLLKRILPGVIIGALAGSGAASLMTATALRCVFIGLTIIVLLKNVLQEFMRTREHTENYFPGPLPSVVIGLVTGVFASLLGIGGSVIIVPFCRHYGLSMLQSAAMANGLAIPIGFIGSLVFIVAGNAVTAELPAYSTGYIYWPAFIFIFLGSLLGSHAGLYWSTRLRDNIYGKIYCFLLCLAIVAMLHQ